MVPPAPAPEFGSMSRTEPAAVPTASFQSVLKSLYASPNSQP
jgi:hypothetical protein